MGTGTGWLQGMWGHLQPPSLDVRLTAQRTRAQGACCFVPSVASVSPFVPTLLLKGPGGAGQGSGALGPRRQDVALPPVPAPGSRPALAWRWAHGSAKAARVTAPQHKAGTGLCHSAVLWDCSVGPWRWPVTQRGCCLDTAGWEMGAKQSVEKGKLRHQWGAHPSPTACAGRSLSPLRAKGCVRVGGGRDQV